MRVRHHLRAVSENILKMPNWYLPGYGSPEQKFFDLWTAELSLGFAGLLYIDAQVSQQHTLELGEFLFQASMQVWCRDGKISRVCTQLVAMMAHPGTPLDASWLAVRLIPSIKKRMCVCKIRTTQLVGMVELLRHLEPHVLRDNPETEAWLQRALLII